MKKLTSKQVVLNHLIDSRKQIRPQDINLIDVVPTQHVNGNTKATIVPATGSVFEGTCRIVYTRIPLTEYLGTSTLTLPPDTYFNTGELLDKINSIYPIVLTIDDIIPNRITAGNPGDQVTLQLSDSCPAWLGSIEIQFNNPALVLSNIFNDVVVQPIPVLETAVKLPVGRTTARLLYWSDDFSILANYFQSLYTGSLIDQEFIEQLNAAGDYTWCNKSVLSNYNLRNSTISYVGPVTECPTVANTNYSHVLVVTIDTKYCNNFGDVLLLHYTA